MDPVQNNFAISMRLLLVTQDMHSIWRHIQLNGKIVAARPENANIQINTIQFSMVVVCLKVCAVWHLPYSQHMEYYDIVVALVAKYRLL